MCIGRSNANPAPVATQIIAAPDNAPANRQGTIEAALRRRRAGAAHDILTGPAGIPAVATMGGRI